MANKDKTYVIILFFVGNLTFFSLLIYLYIYNLIIVELMFALIFFQLLSIGFLSFLYLMHIKFQKLAAQLKFNFITRFVEQPRLEGIYKKNWWQIHFASRSYSRYWGLPRTYIKLQYHKKMKFDNKKLKKYYNYQDDNMQIMSIQHIKKPYKNYLLMRVNGYILDKKKITQLMNFLLKVANDSKS